MASVNELLNGDADTVIDHLMNDDTNLEETQFALINVMRRIKSIETRMQACADEAKGEFVSVWLNTDTHIAGLTPHQTKRVKALCAKFFEAGKESAK